MRFVRVEDKYGEPYTMVQMWDKETRKFKHYDFKHFQAGSEKYVMSPLTGELLPRDRQVIIDHILQYPNEIPVNREI